jgi:catechol 2,3-dioxygenase-like lactoylglutathione lyase family enzyme
MMNKLPKLHSGLGSSKVAARLPAQDLSRARQFYSQKLGLEPIEEREGGIRYKCGEGWFAVYESTGKSSGAYTQMAFEVDNIEETVRELRDRGVEFETYDAPGLKTINNIASVEGNYPSKGGRGERAAWFRDSEGNLLAIGQAK